MQVYKETLPERCPECEKRAWIPIGDITICKVCWMRGRLEAVEAEAKLMRGLLEETSGGSGEKAGAETKNRYRVLSDNDGYTFIVPVGSEELFWKWIDYIEGDGEEPWGGPDFQPIRSLSNYTFTNPRIDL